MVYYNENDPGAAAWLRELVSLGVIPDGKVDDRSILDVQPGDLQGFRQCHFFAGIGGWSEALRLARWPAEREVWTGSCPCQPFSSAGKGLGFDDPRHLWPAWSRLIGQCRPAAILGEQVAGQLGLHWLDSVADSLEDRGYAFASADLPACGVGAWHVRSRLWWVAERQWTVGGVADSGGEGTVRHAGEDGGARHGTGPELHDGSEVDWSDCDWVWCRDGRYRPVEPGSFPLAHGLPSRVGRLRGYGNAIVPQAAAAFVKAVIPALTRG